MHGRRGRAIAYWTLGATLLVLILSAGIFTDVLREAWFLRQLETADEAGRIEAMRELGALGSTRAVPELIRQTNAASEDLRVAAVEAIGAIGSGAEAASPRLIALLLAVEELSGVVWTKPGMQRFPAALEQRRVGSAASVALGRIGAAAVPHLLRELRSGRTYPGRPGPYYDIDSIGAAFGAIGDDAFRILMAELADEDKYYRARVSSVIVDSGPAVVGSLLDELRAEDPYMRSWAAFLLGKLGSAAESALPGLLRRLADEGEDSEVRWQAGRAIARVDSTTPPVAALAGCLDASEPHVRRVVIEALGRCGTSAGPVAARIVESLSHSDPGVRRASCEALALIGVASVAPVLEALRSAHGGERRWVAQALWQIGAKDVAALPGIVAALVDPNASVREEVERILDLIGPRAADALRSAASGDDRELRVAASRVLEALE